MILAAHTPVLVGIGTATCREKNFEDAHEPLALMLAAVRAAGRDCGAAAALSGVQSIAVPRGRWTYHNPASAIGHAIGAAQATTVMASVGVLQQSLLGDACARIQRGEIHTALVTGGDAGYRLLRAQIAGREAHETPCDDEPDVDLAPRDELYHPAETQAGIEMPVALYAILDSAFRARQGWSVDEHRDRLAELMSAFSAVAADNPHAWQRSALSPAMIREAAPRNPMQAFPYTRAHCSTWNVDQSAALLMCSASRAEELGIDRSRWVFPLASSESNHMLAVSARVDIAGCPGAGIAGHAALDVAACGIDDVDLIELYSCFPIAVLSYAEALGIPLSRTLTVTGGMPFAGGPFNNYVFQATCRAAELLRAGRGVRALVSSVSGMLTKQAFGLWSSAPPLRPFADVDVSAQVAAASGALEVASGYSGAATIIGHTVVHGRTQAPRAIALLDTADGERALTTSSDASWITRFENQDCVGRPVSVIGDLLQA